MKRLFKFLFHREGEGLPNFVFLLILCFFMAQPFLPSRDKRGVGEVCAKEKEASATGKHKIVLVSDDGENWWVKNTDHDNGSSDQAESGSKEKLNDSSKVWMVSGSVTSDPVEGNDSESNNNGGAR